MLVYYTLHLYARRLSEVVMATYVLLFFTSLAFIALGVLVVFWLGALFIHQDIKSLVLAVLLTCYVYDRLAKVMYKRLREEFAWFMSAIRKLRTP